SMDVDYDEELAGSISKICAEKGIQAGTEYERDPLLDQGTMVPLYFINKKYTDYKLVRVGLSGFPMTEHYRLGQAIQEACSASGKRVVYVASGDLSHCQRVDGPYGLHPEGPVYDEKIMKTMGSADFGELLEYDPVFLEKAEECGHRSFVIMAGALDGLAVKPHVMTHEATLGVGYGFVSYEVTGRDDSRHFLEKYEKKLEEKSKNVTDPLVKLARDSIYSWVKYGREIDIPDDIPEGLLEKKAGVFVSIHECGDLRGCIGTIEPQRKNIAEEIIKNAISACSRDFRFDPVDEQELPFLTVSVDVLGEAERIDGPDELDVKRYGVICSTPDGHLGLLLPDIDGVDTVGQQIEIACRKGNIDPKDPRLELSRFEVVRHE
ncbi:MAG: AmmeMemoRadiSam system protein A, partial [Anaerovoracaceae bacterium]